MSKKKKKCRKSDGKLKNDKPETTEYSEGIMTEKYKESIHCSHRWN